MSTFNPEFFVIDIPKFARESADLLRAAQEGETLPPHERAWRWINYFEYVASIDDLVPGFDAGTFNQTGDAHADAVTARIKSSCNIDSNEEFIRQLGTENGSVGDAGIAIAD